MPQLISDDGTTAVFQTDDGQTVRVASEYARPYMPPPQDLEPEPAAPAPAPSYPEVLGHDADTVTMQGAWGPVRVARGFAEPYLGGSPPPSPVPDIPLPGNPDAEMTFTPEEVAAQGAPMPGMVPGAFGMPVPEDRIIRGAPPSAPPGLAPEPTLAEPASPVVDPGQPELQPLNPYERAQAPNILPDRVPTGLLDMAVTGAQALQGEADARAAVAENLARSKEQVGGAYERGETELDQLAQRRQRFEETRAKEYTRLHEGISRDVEKMAGWKADQNRFWHDRSTGNKVGLWIAMALSGLGSAIKGQGDRNPALEMVLGFAEQDVQLQLAERDRLGQAIGTKREQLGDFRATTQDRLAEFNAMTASRIAKIAREIETLGAKSDAQGVRDNAAIYAEQLRQEAGNRIGTAAMAQAEANARAAEREQERRARAAAARQKIMDDARKEAENRRRWMLENNVKSIDPATGMYIKGPLDEKEQLELDKLRSEVSIAKGAATGGPGGDPNAIGSATGDPYRNKDGSVFAIKDDFRRKRVSEVNVASQNLRRMADLAKVMKAKYGGASSLAGTEEYQQFVSLAKQVDFETYKLYGLGAPSQGDKEMAEGARGGKDITSFIYDASSGLEAYASGAEQKLNTEMRDAGYTGAGVRLPRMTAAESLDRSKDDSAKLITDGLAPDVRNDPEKRAAEVERLATEMDVTVRHKAPSVQELRGWLQALDKQVKDGKLKPNEAAAIAVPTAVKLLGEEKRRIEGASVAELKELQKDPEYMRRARVLLRATKGEEMTPEAVYQLLVEGL